MSRPRIAVFVAGGLAVALALATFASPFASSSPDGLTRVAQDKGFVEREQLHSLQQSSPAEGYALPGIGDDRVATGLAGLLGTLLVFGVTVAIVALRRRGGAAPPPRGDGTARGSGG